MDNVACETQALSAQDVEHGFPKEDGVKIEHTKLDLIYSIYDTPPWYLSIILGFQHFLTALGGIVSIPFLLLPAMCSTNPIVLSEVINTNFFVSGLVTTCQGFLGVRLPIIQGGTFSFLAPAFAILTLPEWQCPAGNTTDSCGEVILVVNATTEEDDPDAWKLRMREIQGAIILASLVQIVIGVTGVIGIMLRFIGPLVIAPTIALIGIALFEAASNFCADNWYVALMTMVFIIMFSQYLRNVDFPCCQFKRKKGCGCSGYAIFKLFPIILAICASWLVCALLTVTDAIPDDEDHWAYLARTDTKSEVLKEAKWFRFPYPGQWGTPTFSVAGTFGMLAGVIAGIVESVGDYYACARLSGAPPPPVHAINRGILIEGIGCVLAGCWGTGTGTTSYSENVGAIGITKVGSTRVVLFGGIIMMIFGMLGKFGALFVTIPTPVIGGVFMVMFGMISSVGISNLQFVDMNSSRNLFIFGFALFFGLSLPQWMLDNPDAINTGNDVADQVITVLLSTSMFVGGTVAFILDNTVSGTDEERGIHVWRQIDSSRSSAAQTAAFKCYEFPFGMKYINKWHWTQYMPICPTFTNYKCLSKQNTANDVVHGPTSNSTENTEHLRQRTDNELGSTRL